VTLKIYRVGPEDPFIKALIYSEPGVGKTTLAAGAQDHPKMRPVLFLNIEGGLLSVNHRRDLHAIDVSSPDEAEDVATKIATGKKWWGRIRTVVIDNGTELQNLDLQQIVEREMHVVTQGGKRRTSKNDIWQEDYGESTVKLMRIYRKFRHLPIHLVITAHAKYVYPKTMSRNVRQEDLEPTVVLPWLTQKLCKSVMGMVDFVWYMRRSEEDSERREMVTQTDGIIQAKTRGRFFAKRIGPVVENPRLPQLYDALVAAQSRRARPDR
jgi:hypothetical protein